MRVGVGHETRPSARVHQPRQDVGGLLAHQVEFMHGTERFVVVNSPAVSAATDEQKIAELSGRSEPGQLELKIDLCFDDAEALGRVELVVDEGVGALDGPAHPLGQVHVLEL